MWEAFVLKWKKLTREQKFLVCILAVCSLLALGFSTWKVKARITDPFLVPNTELTRIKEIIGSTPEEDEAKLKRVDTDGDSLSDWDEVNLYKTNPNMKDSCGDGMTDNVRVVTGKNIQCAQTTIGIEPMPQTFANDPYQTFLDQPLGSGADRITTGTGQTVFIKSATQSSAGPDQLLPRDPKAIREILKGRVDQAKLDALSDDELLKLYDEAMAVQKKTDDQSQATSVRP